MLTSAARRPAWRLLVIAALALAGGAARPATFTVDDSASVVEAPVAMRWRADQGGARDSAAVDGAARVSLVLNLAPWVGQRARLYMALPPQPVASVTVRWRGHGVLRDGVLRGGQRVLVYEGPIEAATLRERLDVAVSADGRELAQPQRLQFTFEIDLP